MATWSVPTERIERCHCCDESELDVEIHICECGMTFCLACWQEYPCSIEK